jgi:hypothetical protein
MKYFFEIENWRKYFGFIFKQGSNASTTSMHPTPLETINTSSYHFKLSHGCFKGEKNPRKEGRNQNKQFLYYAQQK